MLRLLWLLLLPAWRAACAPGEDQLGSRFSGGEEDYMGRRLSMLSMSESVELRPLPLSLTRSLMRMPGRPAGCEEGGGGVRPSLRGGSGCRVPFCWGGAAA